MIRGQAQAQKRLEMRPALHVRAGAAAKTPRNGRTDYSGSRKGKCKMDGCMKNVLRGGWSSRFCLRCRFSVRPLRVSFLRIGEKCFIFEVVGENHYGNRKI